MPAKRTNRCLLAALLGCTTLVPMALMAQEAEDTALTLGTITVGATADDDAHSVVATTTTAGSKMATSLLDTPASVSVITAKEIEQRNATSTEEVLQYTPGVVTDYYGSDDRFDYIKIRGFEVNTYRDGLPLGNPFGNLREEPYAYERVEVVKGTNSTTFGISEPGGSVNYVTKRPREIRFGEVYATTGSFNHAEIGFDLGDNLTQDDTVSFRLTGKFQDAEKEYDYSRDDETFLMGGLTWRPTDATTLTIVADYLKRNSTPGGGGLPNGVDLDRSTFLGEPDYNYRDIDRKAVSLFLDHDFGGGLSLGSALRYSKDKSSFGYAYVSDYGDATVDTVLSRNYFGDASETERWNADVHLQYDTRFGAITSRTLIGAEYWRTKSDVNVYYQTAPTIDWTNPVYSGRPDSVALYSNTRTDNDGSALYAQQEFTYGDFILSLGLREDWMDIDQSLTYYLYGMTFPTGFSGKNEDLTKRAALTWKATNELSVYASYAESVAPADLGAEPERGTQTEIGVKYAPAGMRALFSAAAYDLTKKNITIFNSDTMRNETIGEYRARGVDLEARAELFDGFSLIGGWSWIDAEITENKGVAEGNRLDFVPETMGSLWATYTLQGREGIGDMTFGLGARFTGNVYGNLGNTMRTPGFTVVDASYSYQLQENTALQINLSNLSDKKVVQFGGAGAAWYNPGRAISATLRHTW